MRMILDCPYNLRHIPEKDQTKEICMEAIKKNPYVLRYVINQDKEMCLIAIKSIVDTIEFVKINDKDIFLYAVKKKGLTLRHIKEQDEEICLEAVKQNCLALKFVLDEYKTKELCLFAVQHNGLSLEFIDEKFQDKNMCLIAVNHNAEAIKFTKIQDYEICLSAVKNKYYYNLLFKYIKSEYRTEELLLEAVKKDYNIIKGLKNPSEQVCLEAVKQNGLMIDYIKNQTKAICLEAIKQNVDSIKYIKKQTKEICLATIKKNIDLIYLVDVKYSKCILNYCKSIEFKELGDHNNILKMSDKEIELELLKSRNSSKLWVVKFIKQNYKLCHDLIILSDRYLFKKILLKSIKFKKIKLCLQILKLISEGYININKQHIDFLLL